MARNTEKANAMLNKWLTVKRTIVDGVSGHRPRHTNDCTRLPDAENWRRQILRELSRKVAEIQNASLGEHRLRDLNDEINHLLREKGRWEEQILQLGGPDYKSISVPLIDSVGIELEGRTGYKYFGAAKELPGVRELFENQKPPPAPRKTRNLLLHSITPTYYGWMDEDDGDLLLAEQMKEFENNEELKRIALASASSTRTSVQSDSSSLPSSISSLMQSHSVSNADLKEGLSESALTTPIASIGQTNQNESEWKVVMDVPTAKDIQKAILEKKKQTLMDRYVSKEQQQQFKDVAHILPSVSSKSSK